MSAEDEKSDRPSVVVISDALWRQRFEGDPTVIGRPLVLDGKPFTIVGVLPRGFRVPRSGQLMEKIDAVVPVAVAVGWWGDHNDQAIGRLRAGVTVHEARAELDVLQAEVSEIATKEAHEPVTLAAYVTPLADNIVGRSRQGLWLLLAAVGAVLLIACGNLANLSLTRAVGRGREAAIRSALGASRPRLIVRAILEQLSLAGVPCPGQS